MHYYPTVFSVFVILQINVFFCIKFMSKVLSFDGSLESVFVDQVETNWYICNFSFSMQRLTLVWVSCLPFQSLSSLNCIVTPLLDHISHIPMVALSKCRTVKKSVSYLYFHEKAHNRIQTQIPIYWVQTWEAKTLDIRNDIHGTAVHSKLV